VRARLKARPKTSVWPWVRYTLGRILQVTGLLVTLLAATAFFGTPSTTAMLRLMLIGVVIFIPGWLLARKPPEG
jgi:CHASE2 domain-containing sensor protein